MEKSQVVAKFQPLFGGTGGIDSWISEATPDDVIARLAQLDHEPLRRSQLNQLLVMSNEAGLSDGFFRFYWLTTPGKHPYDRSSIEGYREAWRSADVIQNQDHLRWGLLRFYTDALMYFGNVRQAYRELRTRTFEEIERVFSERRLDTSGLARRGPPLAFRPIKKDDCYLISEMACKSASSAEFVGSHGLGKRAEGVVEGHFGCLGGPESVGPSGDDFGLAV